MQAEAHGVFIAVPLPLEPRLRDGHPHHECRSSVGGDQIQGDGGVPVGVEVGSIQRDDDLLGRGQDMRDPVRKQRDTLNRGCSRGGLLA